MQRTCARFLLVWAAGLAFIACSDPEAQVPAPSPEYGEWILVYDHQTKVSRRVIEIPYTPKFFGESLTVTDSWVYAKLGTAPSGEPEVHRVALDGSGSEVVYTPSEGESIWTYSLSPDGNSLVVLVGDENFFYRVVYVNPQEGAETEVAAGASPYVYGFSADGSRLAIRIDLGDGLAFYSVPTDGSGGLLTLSPSAGSQAIGRYTAGHPQRGASRLSVGGARTGPGTVRGVTHRRRCSSAGYANVVH